MGKIFDALEKAEKDEKSTFVPDSSVNQTDGRPMGQTAVTHEHTKKTSSHGIHKNLITLLRPNSFEAEQFKILRTKILFPFSGNPPHTIMITSALPGEGKTFVSVNLAASIAENVNEHVLLVDCDLRGPSVHQYFGYRKVRGLSEFLSDEQKLSDLFLKTDIPKLTLLPAGRPPRNPSELLSSKKMADFIDEISHRYTDRYIIIDTPPPGFTAEANVIARKVEAIILVLTCGGTHRDLITNLINLLGKEKIIGAVVNRFDMRASSYAGYGKYRQYEKYRKTA